MSELIAAGIPWSVFNFSVFVAILFFVLRKPVKEFWATRAHEIRFAITEAERVGKDAKARHDELKKRLSRLEMETRDLIRQMEQEGELEKKGMMQQAEKTALRIRQDSEKILSQELLKARQILRAEAVEIAIGLAEKTIADNFKDDDQKRLSDQYLVRLERLGT